MSKLSNAQIREQERKKLIKQLDNKYQYLEVDRDKFKDLYHKYLESNKKLRIENKQLQDRVSELEEQVRKYEDWVNRLQEFMDLPEDQRTEAFKTYCAEMKRSQELNDLSEVYMNIFNRIFSIY